MWAPSDGRWVDDIKKTPLVGLFHLIFHEPARWGRGKGSHPWPKETNPFNSSVDGGPSIRFRLLACAYVRGTNMRALGTLYV